MGRQLVLILLWPLMAWAQPEALWMRSFPDLYNSNEKHAPARQAADGGFFVPGTNQEGSNLDVVLVKLDADGDTVWQRIYGAPDWDEECEGLALSPDGGCLIAGGAQVGGGQWAWAMKVDAAGNPLWQRTYGFSDPNSFPRARTVIPVSTGGYLLVGWVYRAGYYWMDFWAQRISEDGDSLWGQRYFGRFDDQLWAALELADGSFVLGGFSDSYPQPAGENAVLIWTSPGGDSLRSVVTGTPGSDYLQDMVATPDGGIVLAGATSLSGITARRSWLRCVDAEGAPVWNHSYSAGAVEWGYGVVRTAQGNYVFSGFASVAGSWSEGTGFLQGVSATGDSLWRVAVQGPGIYTRTYAVAATADNGFVATSVNGVGSEQQIHVTRFGPEPVLDTAPEAWQPERFQLAAFPNPFNSELRIEYTLPRAGQVTLEVYNLLGQRVTVLTDGLQEAGTHTAAWRPETGAGVYLVSLRTTDSQRTAKILYLK